MTTGRIEWGAGGRGGGGRGGRGKAPAGAGRGGGSVYLAYVPRVFQTINLPQPSDSTRDFHKSLSVNKGVGTGVGEGRVGGLGLESRWHSHPGLPSE